ncbi:MAG: prephenate dehydrogenase [Eubacteriales bacterium]|nr:prephenate dehydrogenase [Eubacteriales bacterium]
MRNLTVAIMGLGLIGGSVAKRLSYEGISVIGYDIDEQTAKNALESGAIGEILPPQEAVAKADVTILSMYPQGAIDFINNYKDYFKKGSILTDVVGIKTPIATLCDSIEANFVYVGGHPMAGKEVCGFDNASEYLFNGANYIVIPSSKASESQILIIEDMVRILGAGTITRTTPQQHDEIIAYTSQLPHVIAVSMCDTPLLIRHNHFTGGSFEDVTRVAKVNAELWAQLFMDNKDKLLAVTEDFEKSISKIKEALKNSDTQTLKEIFTKVKKDKELVESENNKGKS